MSRSNNNKNFEDFCMPRLCWSQGAYKHKRKQNYPAEHEKQIYTAEYTEINIINKNLEMHV